MDVTTGGCSRPGGHCPLGLGSPPMSVTLFGVPASHPSLAAELMLRDKRIGYRRIDLVAVMHRAVLRVLGFPGITVPALMLDGERVQGTRAIAEALDARRPDPPLIPHDSDRRREVDAAESWGDQVYQPVARRLVWGAVTRDGSHLRTYLEGSHLGIPVPVAALVAPPIARAAAYVNEATDENVRRDLGELRSMLDHVDGLLRAGTIGGPTPNVADFQIATSTGLLATLEDLRPLLEGRPALDHARLIAPDYPGWTPKVFPEAWLQA
jgi:glutathione S-transferase